MRLSMKERQLFTKVLADKYRRATKGKKKAMLDQLVEDAGYNRHYAAWLLRNHGRRVQVRAGLVVEGSARVRPTRTGKCTYGEEVRAALEKLWVMFDYVCGKRLAAILPEVVPKLVALKELRVKKSVQRQLLIISASTIDRLLKPLRDKHTFKCRSRTKPGTLLKHQIPIRTFADWDDVRPGFFEMDLVGHDGGKASGDYCFTLNLTDVATGWCELAAVPNKARIWVFEAIKAIRARLPFEILGLDSDNGGEFINEHLKAYCEAEHITFTRSRPYRKNDNCYVEQKNFSVARRCAGYARYDTAQACELLNELYRCLRDYNNFFMPSAKLREKTREGARVTRHHHTPKTPYKQLLENSSVPEAVKTKLTRYYDTLNPAELARRMDTLRNKLPGVTTRSTPPTPEK